MLNSLKYLTLTAKIASFSVLPLTGMVYATENRITVTATAQDATSAQGFVANSSTIATKTTIPPMETPQSVTVITNDRTRLLGAQSVSQMLNYTAGTRGDISADNRGDFAYIRGARATQYLDGLLNEVGYYNNTRPDPYALERAEVLRGPAGMLYGQGAIGGIVNLVTKHPQAQALHEIGISYGNYNRKQIQADFTGAIDKEAHWLYRLVAMGRDSDHLVNYVKDNRYFIAPSLTWQPNADTSLTLFVNLQQDDTNSNKGFFPWRGMITDTSAGRRIPQNFFVSEPDFDKYFAKQRSASYQFRHNFSDNFILRQNVRYSRSTVNYRSIYTSGFNGADHGWVTGSDTELKRIVSMNSSALNQLVIDTQGQLTFSSGSLWHTLLLGLDYQRSAWKRSHNADGSAEPINVWHPVYGNYTAPTSLLSKPASRDSQTGLYAQDQIEWNNWLFTAGLRYDHSRASTDNTPSASRNDSELTKRVGLLYRSDAGINPYISYTESFQGQTGFNKSGQPFKPLYGKQWEAGIKYQPLSENLTITASVFDMREKNRLVAGMVNGIPDSVQLGETRTQGSELEVLASLNQFDLIGAYTYLDAKVITGYPAEQGNQIATTPANSASLWVNYNFTLFNTPGFTIGGGVRYTGHSHDGTGNNHVGGVTLYDTVLSWDNQKVRIALNGTNLFDNQYVASCIPRGDCFFGTRRSIIGSVSYRF